MRFSRVTCDGVDMGRDVGCKRGDCSDGLCNLGYIDLYDVGKKNVLGGVQK